MKAFFTSKQPTESTQLANEEACLQELRSRMGPLPEDLCPNSDTDATLRRFLKARGNNVEKAEKMLRATLEWRKENDIANVFLKAPDDETMRYIRSAIRHSHHGFDKKGRPVYIEQTGRNDTEMLTDRSKLQTSDLVNSHLIMMEYQVRVMMREASMRNGVTVHEMCNILDLEGLSLKHMGPEILRMFRAVAVVDQDHYPEQLGGAYIINAPWVFSTVWNAISKILDKRTQEKVYVLSKGKKQTEELLKIIDAESLPEFLGGVCRCEGGCVSGPEHCTSESGMTMNQRKVQDWVLAGMKAHSERKANGHAVA
mmetsp:Transcript_40840/g.49556  ORF Transcript_40840/g.49556 Transcript_40840/m.49556 type:complete len:312 (-) Transcript_40840:232-1167(-)|eukprot:CAMPEP_0197846402 /NCGR_PEP_ID=MMETSP1438-20131217/3151_1 /TAXON_ID=1461541 /ORGANISM="Pterosperma sp., Strain CCMP1384" /LENGTH=311 /DNA_ID=CAMNT_0043458043 /DNA_START=837 /DNA_END=1772 /DNA_ORIENTATION=+